MILELTQAVAVEEGREVEDLGPTTGYNGSANIAPLVQSYGAGMNGSSSAAAGAGRPFGDHINGAMGGGNPYVNGAGGGAFGGGNGGMPYR